MKYLFIHFLIFDSFSEIFSEAELFVIDNANERCWSALSCGLLHEQNFSPTQLGLFF